MHIRMRSEYPLVRVFPWAWSRGGWGCHLVIKWLAASLNVLPQFSEWCCGLLAELDLVLAWSWHSIVALGILVGPGMLQTNFSKPFGAWGGRSPDASVSYVCPWARPLPPALRPACLPNVAVPCVLLPPGGRVQGRASVAQGQAHRVLPRPRSLGTGAGPVLLFGGRGLRSHRVAGTRTVSRGPARRGSVEAPQDAGPGHLGW